MKILMGFCLLVLLSGCAGNGSSTSSSNPTDERAKVLLGNVGKSSFQSGQELPADDTSRFTIGCQHPGGILPTGEFDKRLKPGFSYAMYYRSVDTSGYYRELLTETGLKSLNADPYSGVGYNMSLLSSTGMGKTTSLWPHRQKFANGTVANINCRQMNAENGMITWSCMNQPDLYDLESQIHQADDDSNCGFIQGNFESTKQTLNLGTFKLATGSSVPAYQSKWTGVSKVVCDGAVTERAIETLSLVYSNDVPALSMPWIYCGGQTIKYLLSLVGDSGKVYFLIEYELLEFKN